MEIVLEVSEKEDYSEFPITEKQTVEITSKNKQGTQHREVTSLASEKKTEDKSTQTISRRVWRKIKKKELIRQQNATCQRHFMIKILPYTNYPSI